MFEEPFQPATTETERQALAERVRQTSQWFTTTQAARLAARSAAHIARLCRQGRIAAIKDTSDRRRPWLIHSHQLAELIAQHPRVRSNTYVRFPTLEEARARHMTRPEPIYDQAAYNRDYYRANRDRIRAQRAARKAQS